MLFLCCVILYVGVLEVLQCLSGPVLNRGVFIGVLLQVCFAFVLCVLRDAAFVL